MGPVVGEGPVGEMKTLHMVRALSAIFFSDNAADQITETKRIRR
jgi:hypothetical protein